jgi:hypothetical protein
VEHIPVGTVLQLVVIDLFLVEALSAIFGVVVARAGGASPWLGLVVGLLLPVVGPLVWSLVVISRNPSLLAVERLDRGGPGRVAASSLLGLAAILLLVSTTQPWAHVAGSYEDYEMASFASPADTGVGMLATVGTAVLLIAGTALLLLFTARRRVAMLTGFIAGGWLLATLDGLIVISAVDDVARTAEGVSGGRVAVEAGPAAALWLCLAAAVLTLAGTVVALSLGDPVTDELPQAVAPPAASSSGGWGDSSGSDWGVPTHQGGTRPGSTGWDAPGPSDWDAPDSSWNPRSASAVPGHDLRWGRR